jgi:hypothetical protein
MNFLTVFSGRTRGRGIHVVATKTRFFHRLSCFIVATVVVVPEVVRAEFACSAEVSYKWVKGKVAAESGGASTTPRAGAGATGTAGAGAAPASVVRFSSVERTGADEVAAKAALQTEINRQKVRASEACKRDHEGYGACVATKLSVQSSALNSLSFSVRSEVEKAILAECREQQGSCVTVESGDPACKEVVVVAAPAAAAGDAKKPDGKKADGKKK